MIEFERKVEIIDLTGPGQMTADKLVESRLFCIKEEKVIIISTIWYFSCLIRFCNGIRFFI